ncbi:MAG: hemin uptake protein HemP [Methylocystaceae bacterium]|nr:hemin uptake protein HemP [Methylocystaceae bacterium]
MQHQKTDVDTASTRSIVFEQNRIDSEQLFTDIRELIIVHNNEEYKLRITGNSKLILTK